jgi:hypothetical protein
MTDECVHVTYLHVIFFNTKANGKNENIKLLPENRENKKVIMDDLVMSEYDSRIVLFDDREAEKRERLVQTYIVLFGLLLSYDQVGSLQSTAMSFFLLFLFLALLYYAVLNSRSWMRILLEYYGVRRVVFILNFVAFMSSVNLGYIILLFFFNVGDIFSHWKLNYLEFYTSLLLLSSFLFLPLLISRDMFR